MGIEAVLSPHPALPLAREHPRADWLTAREAASGWVTSRGRGPLVPRRAGPPPQSEGGGVGMAAVAAPGGAEASPLPTPGGGGAGAGPGPRLQPQEEEEHEVVRVRVKVRDPEAKRPEVAGFWLGRKGEATGGGASQVFPIEA